MLVGVKSKYALCLSSERVELILQPNAAKDQLAGPAEARGRRKRLGGGREMTLKGAEKRLGEGARRFKKGRKATEGPNLNETQHGGGCQ